MSLVVVLWLCALATPSASAECRTVYNETLEGRWENNDCTVEDTYKRRRKVVAEAGFVSGNYECREVEAGEEGYWSNTECSVPGIGPTRKYVWIFRFPFCEEAGGERTAPRGAPSATAGLREPDPPLAFEPSQEYTAWLFT